MAVVNLAASAIANIEISSIGAAVPYSPPYDIIVCGADEVYVVENLYVLCDDPTSNGVVYAQVVSESPAPAFEASIAYQMQVIRNKISINLLLGRTLYLSEGQTLQINGGSPGGTMQFMCSFARVTN